MMLTPDNITTLFYKQDSTWGRVGQKLWDQLQLEPEDYGIRQTLQRMRQFLASTWSQGFGKWTRLYPQALRDYMLEQGGRVERKWPILLNEVLRWANKELYPIARTYRFPDSSFIFPDITVEGSVSSGSWYNDNDLLAAALGVAAIASPGVGLAMGVAQKANNVVAAAKAGDATAKKKVAAVATLAKAGDAKAIETVKTMKVISHMQDAKTFAADTPSWYDSGLGRLKHRRRPFSLISIGHRPYTFIGGPEVRDHRGGGGGGGGVSVTASNMGRGTGVSRPTSGINGSNTVQSSYQVPGGPLIRSHITGPQAGPYRCASGGRPAVSAASRWGESYQARYPECQAAPGMSNIRGPNFKGEIRRDGLDPDTGLPPVIGPPIPGDPYGTDPYGQADPYGGGYPPYDPYGQYGGTSVPMDPYGGGGYDPYGQYGGGYDPYGGQAPYDPYGQVGLPYDPSGGYYDPNDPVCSQKQVYDPDTDSFFSNQVNQVYDPDTNSFAPVANYNPYNPYMTQAYGGDGGGYPFDPRVAGWATNIPYRTTAQQLAQVEKSPGIAVAARELYNQGLGRPKTGRSDVAREVVQKVDPKLVKLAQAIPALSRVSKYF